MSLQRNEHEIYCFILSILGLLKEWVNIMILLTILAFSACDCNQGTSTWWRWATDPYRLSPWVNSVHAVMAGIERKCFTMQGFGTPVSALGQGGKAGSPMSSSCNRSSSSMGNLVYGESYATRKKTLCSLNAHDCHKNVNSFCYICTKYEVTSLWKKIDDEVSTLYEQYFGHKVLHQETNSQEKKFFRAEHKSLFLS